MKKLTGWKLTVVRVLVLLLVVGLTVFLFINRDRVKELEALGYPGVFLVSLLANATLILPVPGVFFPLRLVRFFKVCAVCGDKPDLLIYVDSIHQNNC